MTTITQAECCVGLMETCRPLMVFVFEASSLNTGWSSGSAPAHHSLFTGSRDEVIHQDTLIWGASLKPQ